MNSRLACLDPGEIKEVNKVIELKTVRMKRMTSITKQRINKLERLLGLPAHEILLQSIVELSRSIKNGRDVFSNEFELHEALLCSYIKNGWRSFLINSGN